MGRRELRVCLLHHLDPFLFVEVLTLFIHLSLQLGEFFFMTVTLNSLLDKPHIFILLWTFLRFYLYCYYLRNNPVSSFSLTLLVCIR